jgi:hypothetical protein
VFSAVCDVAEKLQRGLGGAHKQKMGLVDVEIPWVVAATVLHPLLLLPMEDPQKRVLSPMKQLVDGFMAKSPLKQQLRITASRYLRGTGAAGADAELLFYLGRQGIYKTDEEETLWAATFTSPPEVWWQMFGNFHPSKLAAVAARLGRVPAGTAAIERVFSIMGWQSEKRRNRLLSEKIH